MRRRSIVWWTVGIVLLAGAVVIRFAVAPTVAKLPPGTNTTITLQGTAPVLLDQSALAPGSTSPLQLTNLPLSLRETTRVLQTNATAAVCRYVTSGSAAGHPIPGFDDRYAVDRTTLEASNAISAPGLVPARGLTVSFPIGTQKHDYEGWVQDTWTTSPLHYAGTATSVGVPTSSGVKRYQFGFPAYVFTQSIPPTRIVDRQELSQLPSGVPKAQAAAVASQLPLPASLSSQLGTLLASLPDPVPLAYTYSGTYTYWVAPADGMLLDIQASETRSVELPPNLLGTAVPLTTASQFRYTDTAQTLLAQLHHAQNDASALMLLRTTIPLIALVLGIVCLAAAFVVGRRRVDDRGPPTAPPPTPEAVPERPRAMAARR